jgi:WD40 repeat protein
MKQDEQGVEKLVWNPECPVAGHSAEVNSVDFSPDGNRVVSGSDDNLVRIWDVATGALVSSLVGVRCGW